MTNFTRSHLLALVLSGLQTAAAAVVYTSNSFSNSFGTTPSASHDISNIGWTADFGTGDFISTPTTISNPVRAGVFDGTSGSAPFTLTDYIYVQKSGPTNLATLDQDAMLRTTGVTAFSPASYSDLTATWHRNGDNAASVRLMIQTGSQWYISDVNTNATGNGTVTYPALSLNLLTSTWTTLGSNVSFGTETGITYATLFGAGQTITGIGFYLDDLAIGTGGGLTTARFDNLVVDGTLIPESSTSLLGVLGFSYLALRRRK